MSEKGERIKQLTSLVMDNCATCCDTWLRWRNAQLHKEGDAYFHEGGEMCAASALRVELDRIAGQ